MIFKILKIKRIIKQGTKDPGALAKDESQDALIGLLLIPAFGVFLWLALTFILGFTKLLGGPMGFFKLIFIVSLIGSFIIFFVLRKIIKFAGKTVGDTVNKVSNKKVTEVDFKVEK